MQVFLMQVLFTIREALATPALLAGAAVLMGLLLQKKPAGHVVRGTVTAVVGFVLLSAGSDLLQNGALRDFSVLFNYDFHIQGVIPNMEAAASAGMAQYAVEVSMVMLFGMAANIIMARFGLFHYIFLTGHHTLYMACLLTMVMHAGGLAGWRAVTAGGLMLGLLMALMPALAQDLMRKVTGGDSIALGHFSVIGYLVSAKAAAFAAGRKRRMQGKGGNAVGKSTEKIHFPEQLSFMRDSVTSMFLVMTVMFLAVSGIAAARTDLSALDLSYREGGYQNWVIYAVMQGAWFSASIYMILAGVRLVIAEIVPAFKGIAKKMAPHAKPAVDCPVIFSYAPNAVMIGFFMSFAGGIVTMLSLMGLNAWHGAQLVPVIVPGAAVHFFCGGSAGVFCNAQGGAGGCVTGSFIHGIVITVLSLAVMPVLGTFHLAGTSFSDSDFCAAGVLLGKLASVMSGNGLFLFCIFCFMVPIVLENV